MNNRCKNMLDDQLLQQPKIKQLDRYIGNLMS